ncbi:MAG: glycosyltransferase family 1 protein [Burkholderiaceae bacterium]
MKQFANLRGTHLVDMTMFYAAEGGGVHTYVKAKARWLARRPRLRHSVIAPTLRSDMKGSSVHLASIPLPLASRYRVPISVSSVARKTKAIRPNLIEVGDPFQFAWAALKIKQSISIPIVAFYHSDLSTILERRYGSVVQHAGIRYLQSVYRNFDLVLAPSRQTSEYLRGLGIERVCHQPLGVDTRKFSPRFRDASLRERLNLAPDTRLLVYAGRFTAEKKLGLLIDAVHALGAPYHLLMVGSGAPIPSSPQITCLPFERNSEILSGMIGGCDLLVHPGDQETFGLVVLEAMASGIPVLGVQAGGVAELIDPSTGLLVAPGSCTALIEGIRTLFRQDLHQMGVQARRKVCEHYDWNVIFPQLLQKYSSLLSNHR